MPNRLSQRDRKRQVVIGAERKVNGAQETLIIN